jgi:hypothetical protein
MSLDMPLTCITHLRATIPTQTVRPISVLLPAGVVAAQETAAAIRLRTSVATAIAILREPILAMAVLRTLYSFTILWIIQVMHARQNLPLTKKRGCAPRWSLHAEDC